MNLYAYVQNDAANQNDPTGNASSSDGPKCPGNPACPTTGTPQKTFSKGVETGHAKASEELMEEMLVDSTRAGDSLQSGSFNESGRKATEGAIDTAKRGDSVLTSTTTEGDRHIRIGEVGSPKQTEQGQKGKWEAERGKLPKGTKMTVFFKALKKIPGLGAILIGGQLIFDEDYTVEDAAGDMVNAEPAE